MATDMRDWNKNDWHDWNKQIIEEFRTHGGKVGGPFEGLPLLLLTNTGAKSGEQRVNPLAYTENNGHIYIFAAKSGAPTNPDWYHNVVTHPDVTVEVGDQKFNAKAVVIAGKERDVIYAKQGNLVSIVNEYQQKTTRAIPVIELIRQ